MFGTPSTVSDAFILQTDLFANIGSFIGIPKSFISDVAVILHFSVLTDPIFL